MQNNAIARAIDLINSSGYIRLCTGAGIRRISRAAAINAVLNTCRCKDCKDTNSDLCDACDQTVSTMEIQGYFIHLDGYGCDAIIHV